MSTEFERTRVDVAGRGVTITSWYEPAKQRFRANAPAFLHLFNQNDSETAVNFGQTREGAIRVVRDHLSRCLNDAEARRHW